MLIFCDKASPIVLQISILFINYYKYVVAHPIVFTYYMIL